MRLTQLLAVPALLVAVAMPARAQLAADSAVQVSYDQDTDSTAVTLVVPFSGHAPKGRVFGGRGAPDFTWTIGFVGAGHGPLVVGSVTSIFAFKEKMPIAYYNAHVRQLAAIDRLELVIDGQALPAISLPPVLGTAVPDERSGRVTLERTYVAMFAPEMLRRIAAAAEAEGRLHGRAFVIDDEARGSLRALVAHLTPVDAAVAERAGR